MGIGAGGVRGGIGLLGPAAASNSRFARPNLLSYTGGRTSGASTPLRRGAASGHKGDDNEDCPNQLSVAHLPFSESQTAGSQAGPN
jgi:hypothetical protein